MKFYIYNINNKNEFLNEIDVESTVGLESFGTEIAPRQSNIIGKSYAFNKEANEWNILIDDWRGITLYNKNNSLITSQGDLNPVNENYTYITPPDLENAYKYENNQWNPLISPEQYVANELKKYENAIQQHIDETAQARGYDNGYTCASYFDDKNARYASDARIFKDWRSDVWVYVNELLNSYKAGTLQEIPSIEDVIAALPVIQWAEE